MTFREKCSLAVQVLRESMTICWRNRILWAYAGLFFFSVIAVGAGSGLLVHVFGQTLVAQVLIVALVCAWCVVFCWIMFAFFQKVTALLQKRALFFRESFKSPWPIVWQFIIGTLLLSCGYSFFVLPLKLVTPFTFFYWVLLPIAVVGYWIVVLIAILFTPILFSERINAIPALKRAALLAKSYWAIMTLAYGAVLVGMVMPLILGAVLVRAVFGMAYMVLTIVLFPFVLLWLIYAFLVMIVFWFVFYNKIKSVH